MDVPTHIDALRVDGARLAAAVGQAGPDAPVPTCPDWAVRDLVHHQGAVHRWAADYVSQGVTDPGAVDFARARGPLPDDADLVEWFLSGHAALVAALAGASPDLQCWSFLPAPSPRAFWARRQAHETSIHRVDAELAADTTPSTIDAAFAADGLDELLVAFGSARARRTEDGERDAIVVAVRCTDVNAGWTVRHGSEGVSAVATGAAESDSGNDAAPDCTVRGAAADLYLTLWRRRHPDGLTVEGDGRAFDLLLERARI